MTQAQRGIDGIWHFTHTPQMDGMTVHEDAQRRIVAHARLDNRPALLTTLSMPPDTSAAALILAAYARWGENCPQQLLGDFAFAIWDAPKRTLFLARDQLGVRPLFYAVDAAHFAFASSVKRLLEMTSFQLTPNERMIGVYLAASLPQLEADMTFYRDIHRLPHAHSLTISADSPTPHVRSYWSLTDAPDVRYPSDEEYADAFRAILEAAVSARLASASGEIGAALSGGLDSSSVVALVHQKTALHTFYMYAPESDERAYVDAMIQRVGITHHIRSLPSPLAQIERTLTTLGTPTQLINFPLTYDLLQAAADQGIRSFFDGVDGDVTLSYGRRRLIELLAQGEYAAFKEEIHALSAAQKSPPQALMTTYAFPYLDTLDGRTLMRVLGKLGHDFGVSPLELAFRWGRNRYASGAVMRAVRQVRRGGSFSAHVWQQMNPALNPEFVRRINLEGVLRARRPAPPLTARDEHLQNFQVGFLSVTLDEYDAIGAVTGVECLHPLTDRRVLEFAVGLPAEQKFRHGLTRWILRQALRDILPKSIAQRGDKVDFQTAFVRAFREHDLPTADALFFDPPPAAAAYFEVSKLQKLYRSVRDGGGSVSAFRVVIRSALLLAWLRHQDPPRSA